MPEPRPTDEQRARWQDAIATDLNGLDWYERRDDLIDAIFAAGAKAALDAVYREVLVYPPGVLYTRDLISGIIARARSGAGE